MPFMQNTSKTAALLTQGSVVRSVVRFAIPYLASYLLQTLYGLADLFLVGRLAGVADTTAVAIGSQVMHIITVLCVSLAMGSTVLVGRAVGKKDNRAAAKAIGNTASLFAIVSVIATVVLTFLAPLVVRAMSTPLEAAGATHSYITICFLALPAIAAYNVTASVLRGTGDSKSPLLFVAASCVLNIALDCFFIGALHLGSRGAALGTVLSQLFSVIFAFAYIRRRFVGEQAEIPLCKGDFLADTAVMKELVFIGMPVALQDGFIQLSFIVITVIANARGIIDAAAVGIVEKVIGIMFLVPSSMLSTVSVMTAQCAGAGDAKRAQKSLRVCLAISLAAGVFFCAVTVPFSSSIVSLFTRESIVALRGGEYLKSYVFDCILAGLHFCFSGYFCAMGLSYLSFLHNAISAFCVRIPLAYLLSSRFPDTLFPMGCAPPAGSALSLVICVAVYAAIGNRE